MSTRKLVPCLAAAFLCTASLLAQNPKPTAKAGLTADLPGVVNTFWSRWDKDGNNSLDRRELVAVLKDPATKDVEACIAAKLYQKKYKSAGLGKPVSVSKDELFALSKDAKFAGDVKKAHDHLAHANRALFTKGDPNLEGFRQGATGDCFLLASLALLVAQRPGQLRTMFSTLENGDIRVTMGDGQAITIAPLTDGELLLGASFGQNSGVWLNAFEKAYAQIWKKTKERNVEGGLSDDEAMHSEFLSGGLAIPTLQTLTGHKTDGFRFGKEAKEQEVKREELHALLPRLLAEKKLILLHTRRDADKGKGFVKPPRWPDAHTFALFGYDPDKRIVHCFNPWGNTFTPKGRPGRATGYETKGGLFDMPLNELVALFKAWTYETDEPLATVGKRSTKK